MITMSDVAKKAGVSRTTASFVLNGKETELRIGAETRERVIACARELGYRRNDLARAIASGKNFVFGILDFGQNLEQRARIMEGALAESNPHGYFIKLFHFSENDDILEIAKRCVEQRLAGLIVRLPSKLDMATLNSELSRHQIPIVTVDDDFHMPGISNVRTDDRVGIQLALNYLLELGHRDIVLIYGDEAISLDATRVQIFKDFIRDNRLPAKPENLLMNRGLMRVTEDLVKERFCNEATRPTAIFSASGDFAAAVSIRALRALGISVPKQVSIIGYADLQIATLTDPPLTTIRQPFEELGRLAIRTLLEDIELGLEARSSSEGSQFAQTELVLRGTTDRVFQSG